MSRVVVYSTPYCPYCVRAKNLLQSKGVYYEEIDVAKNPALRGEMQQLSGGYTVPQILINNQPIGGCDELHTLERTHELDKLLA